MSIEVEIRSFVSEKEYNELLAFFKKNSEFVNEDDQVTYYFDCEQDLRIQKNSFFSKIWMKKGRIHDEHREELEIRFAREDFDKLEELFIELGFKVEIKWFRKRHTFKWQNIDVMVDFTKGYGYIIELEKKCTEKEKDKTLALLKERMRTLKIPLTPREEFEKKYEHYKKNWRKLTGEK